MTGYVEVSGPDSLTGLVLVISGQLVEPVDELVTLPAPRGCHVVAQYDEVDADTWPYLISVESHGDVSPQVRAIADRLRSTGWAFRAFVDDDQLIAESMTDPD